MISEKIFYITLNFWFFLAGLTFIVLFFIPAPYGRYRKKGWGPVINGKAAWLVMESLSVLVMGLCFYFSDQTQNIPVLVFFLLWQFHYVYRAYIFPLTRRGRIQPMPIVIMSFAIVFNSINAFLNGYFLFQLSPSFNTAWFIDIRFILGTVLFFSGFVMHVDSDRILNKLRNKEQGTYYIPHGHLFKFISCPNYLGEIIQWSGWALATWSLAGLSFAVWTVANLVPRAFSHHGFYKQRFKDYPKNRKALIPFII